jgi:hypothetical protein
MTRATTRLPLSATIGFDAKHGIQHPRCAAYTVLYEERTDWTVTCTGTTLHTRIPLRNDSLSLLHRENVVRTDLQTTATPTAEILIQAKRHDIF